MNMLSVLNELDASLHPQKADIEGISYMQGRTDFYNTYLEIHEIFADFNNQWKGGKKGVVL